MFILAPITVGVAHIDLHIFTERFYMYYITKQSYNIALKYEIVFSSAILGLLSLPKDFATYLLAIFIINLLMYFAFYIIMKVSIGINRATDAGN